MNFGSINYAGALNTGNYYGSGYTSGGYGYGGAGRVASSQTYRRMGINSASGYSADFELIQKYMKNGQVDKAMKLYQSLFDDIQQSTSGYGYTMNDSEVQSVLKSAYESATGTSMISSIEKNTDGAFVSGLFQGLPIVGLFACDTTEQEALATYANDKVSFKDKLKEYGGALLSGLGTGAAAGAAIGAFGGPIGAVGGAAIGAVIGIGQTALKDIF